VIAAGITERRVIQMARRQATGSGSGVRVGIGDDCAVLEPTSGAALLATTDLLIEDVHFRRRRAEPADIGWKALAVNLSDVAAMGGRPRWALVALACPTGTPAEEVDAFFEGLLALAREHDVAVVGGDTSSSPAGWVVNVTVLGEAPHPRLRSTARAGDVIAVTGVLGRSAAGLAILERDRAPSGVGAATLSDVTSAQLRPVPRVREGRWLGEVNGVTAMIDLSDGLATDLGHIADESGVGALVDLGRLPVSDPTRRVAQALADDWLAWATGGGEDYELLLTCEPRAFAPIADGLVRATGTPLVSIGQITEAGTGVRFVDDRGRARAVAEGFQHFGHGPDRPGAPPARRRGRRRARVR
jgi:thiamine-monophosphate kinase